MLKLFINVRSVCNLIQRYYYLFIQTITIHNYNNFSTWKMPMLLNTCMPSKPNIYTCTVALLVATLNRGHRLCGHRLFALLL